MNPSPLFRAGRGARGSVRSICCYLSAAVVTVALRTQRQSPPEQIKCSVLPSLLIHLVGKLHVSPGLTSQDGVYVTVLHGPHGSPAVRAMIFCDKPFFVQIKTYRRRADNQDTEYSLAMPSHKSAASAALW